MSRRPLSPRQAADLAAFACHAELAADKPGNVTLRRGLPGLRPADFLRSAEALRSAFSRRPMRSVGALVLDTIRRTRRRVRTNTNLGLALILAPLALASTRPGPGHAGRRAGHGELRPSVERLLRSLGVRDAEQVYEGIRLAAPGGMGKVEAEDVSGKPRRNLRACMALAARRDAIASEYARGYPLTFGVGAPALRRWRNRGLPLDEAVVMTYLTLLARRSDSLIARRHGPAVARRVSRRAAQVLSAGGTRSPRGRRALAFFDAWLRRSRLNPGTTADLTAAAVFAAFADVIAEGRPARRSLPARRGRQAPLERRRGAPERRAQSARPLPGRPRSKA